MQDHKFERRRRDDPFSGTYQVRTQNIEGQPGGCLDNGVSPNGSNGSCCCCLLHGKESSSCFCISARCKSNATASESPSTTIQLHVTSSITQKF
ncbi:hypothetical protein JTE90_011949 [Oedothorax gibbosus]|uniref:Uncharacterized protein n=1 Tax=Oedothorax gibbosus TaxID=931172 RepID=A0AAV6V2J3_9ARAC|nr:hypothetical protein JTE90_011949 [Oedothorax gibbosus]